MSTTHTQERNIPEELQWLHEADGNMEKVRAGLEKAVTHKYGTFSTRTRDQYMDSLSEESKKYLRPLLHQSSGSAHAVEERANKMECRINQKMISQIITHRRLSNMSQRELSRRSGVTQTVISRMENNLMTPQLKTLTKLLDVLDLDVEIKVTPKSEKTQPQTKGHYGGITTRLATLEPGTKFHVHNGAWDGEIIMRDNVKCVLIDGDTIENARIIMDHTTLDITIL